MTSLPLRRNNPMSSLPHRLSLFIRHRILVISLVSIALVLLLGVTDSQSSNSRSSISQSSVKSPATGPANPARFQFKLHSQNMATQDEKTRSCANFENWMEVPTSRPNPLRMCCAEQNAARSKPGPVQLSEIAHFSPLKSSSEAPAQPQFIGEKATTTIKDSDLELHVLSPPFNPTFTTTGAGVELIGTATGPNQIIQISWSSNLGEFGIAQGSSSWRSGRIPLATGNNSITMTATDASNSSVANPWIQTAPSQTLEGTLEIVWGDPQPGSGSDGDIRYALRLADGSVVPLQLTGQEGEAVS